ncbi:MAG: hypothetical protein ACQEQE_05760 [Bacillota bacterium]
MIKKDTELIEIVENYPKTEDFFHLFDKPLNRCILCENLFDTVEKIAETYDFDLEKLLMFLNNTYVN